MVLYPLIIFKRGNVSQLRQRGGQIRHVIAFLILIRMILRLSANRRRCFCGGRLLTTKHGNNFFPPSGATKIRNLNVPSCDHCRCRSTTHNNVRGADIIGGGTGTGGGDIGRRSDDVRSDSGGGGSAVVLLVLVDDVDIAEEKRRIIGAVVGVISVCDLIVLSLGYDSGREKEENVVRLTTAGAATARQSSTLLVLRIAARRPEQRQAAADDICCFSCGCGCLCYIRARARRCRHPDFERLFSVALAVFDISSRAFNVAPLRVSIL